MGPKERHLRAFQDNEDAEKNLVVQRILKEGSLGHDSDRRQKRKTASDSRTRNQGGSPTTKR